MTDKRQMVIDKWHKIADKWQIGKTTTGRCRAQKKCIKTDSVVSACKLAMKKKVFGMLVCKAC